MQVICGVLKQFLFLSVSKKNTVYFHLQFEKNQKIVLKALKNNLGTNYKEHKKGKKSALSLWFKVQTSCGMSVRVPVLKFKFKDLMYS